MAMDSITARRIYDEAMHKAVVARTKYETHIKQISASYYKLPADLLEKMEEAVREAPEAVRLKIEKKEEFTLQDFMPVLYDMEHRDRKKQAEQLFLLNRFRAAWERMRLENEEEILKCNQSLIDKNL